MPVLHRWKGLFAGSSTVLLLAACGTTSDPEATRKSLGAHLYEGVQVGVGHCVTSQPPTGKGLTDTVLTALVSKGVNLLGNALSEAGNDKTWKTVASRNLSGGAVFPACVQVVRGRFATDKPAAEAPWLKEYAPSEDAYTLLKRNGLWPADKPDFFFEGAIVLSEDKTAATIRPVLAVLNKPQGTRGTSGAERSVVGLFAFSTAGTRPDLDTNPAATVVLGTMWPGQILKFPSAGEMPASSTPYESSWFTLSEADARNPLTLTALVAETQPGSAFFAFLASIFNDESVKSAATDRANVIFVPGAREAAEKTRTGEQRTAADSADTKLADAIGKLAECKAADNDGLAKAVAAKTALRGYLAADAALPNPMKKIRDQDIDLINIYVPAEVSARCNDLYEKLTGKRL